MVLFALAGLYRFLAIDGWSNGLTVPFLNVLTQSLVIWRYVGLILWPFGQSVMHSVHHVTHPSDPFAWIADRRLSCSLCVVAFDSGASIR